MQFLPQWLKVFSRVCLLSKLKIAPNGKTVFPEEGAYDFMSENGCGYCFPQDDILFVPIITAYTKGQGLGTKLIIELEQLVQETPELREVAIPNIMNRFLLRIVLKRGYIHREEYDENFGETVDIYYKTFKSEEND